MVIRFLVLILFILVANPIFSQETDNYGDNYLGENKPVIPKKKFAKYGLSFEYPSQYQFGEEMVKKNIYHGYFLDNTKDIVISIQVFLNISLTHSYTKSYILGFTNELASDGYKLISKESVKKDIRFQQKNLKKPHLLSAFYYTLIFKTDKYNVKAYYYFFNYKNIGYAVLYSAPNSNQFDIQYQEFHKSLTFYE